MKLLGPLVVVYVALVVLANWLAAHYVITVPFTDYLAPAGVLAVGAVLVMRDWIQQIAGLVWASGLILVAGVLSYLIGVVAGYGSLQKIALASLAAFIVSEGIVEAALFTPLRKRHLTLGVALSATVGNLVDSVIFLSLAFGWASLHVFLAGNFIGKLEMIAVGVALTAARRKLMPVNA